MSNLCSLQRTHLANSFSTPSGPIPRLGTSPLYDKLQLNPRSLDCDRSINYVHSFNMVSRLYSEGSYCHRC